MISNIPKTKINLFGPPRIERNGRIIKPDTSKAIALIAYIICASNLIVSREKAATLLWPDYPEKRALANLRRTLFSLTKAVGEHVILADRQTIQIKAQSISCDVLELTNIIESLDSESTSAIEELKTVVGMFRQGFLEGFTVKDNNEFASWVWQEKQSLEHRITAKIQNEISVFERVSQTDKVIQLTNLMLTLDNLDESMHQKLMRLYAKNDEFEKAITQYQNCLDLLQRELQVAPQLETVNLYKQIQQGAVQSDNIETPNQLPPSLTTFVNRFSEYQTLQEQLLTERPVKIFSIEGMGGVGKTALAIKVAKFMKDKFPDGILWAQLDSSKPLSILGSFADAYGSDVSQHQTIQARSQAVRSLLTYKKAIIVLDNVESSEQVKPLLPGDSASVVLITTRKKQLAATRGAFILQLDPFNEENADALKLFKERLGDAYVAEHQETLLKIAYQLGHLPLALDISASRLAHEPGWQPEDFLRRLKKQSRLLKELQYEEIGVQASLQTSFDELEKREQSFFSILGLFEGRDFDDEAASIIGDLNFDDAQDHIRLFHNLSLLTRTKLGRNRLHPLVATFSRSHLKETVTITQRMIHYFIAYLERFQKDYRLLQVEQSNILFVLELTKTQNNIEEFIKGVNLIFPYLKARGLQEETKLLLDHAESLIQSPEIDVKNTSGTLLRLGKFAFTQGNIKDAFRHYQLALDVANEVGNLNELAWVQIELGEYYRFQGDYAEAETYFSEAEFHFTNLGESVGLAQVSLNLGTINAQQGRFDEAKAYYNKSLSLWKALGNKEKIGSALNNLGIVERFLGNFEKARTFYEEALDVRQQNGDRWGIANSLTNLGNIALDLRHFETAQTCLSEAVELQRKIGDQSELAIHLNNLGNFYRLQNQLEQAVVLYLEGMELYQIQGDLWGLAYLFEDMGLLAAQKRKGRRAFTMVGFANQLRERINAPRSEAEEQQLVEGLAPVDSRLSQAQRDNYLNNGRSLSLEEAITYAKNR